MRAPREDSDELDAERGGDGSSTKKHACPSHVAFILAAYDPASASISVSPQVGL